MLSAEYTAGFFDGEGCINITVSGHVRQVVLRVMVVNTEPTILALLQAQFGGVLHMPRAMKEGWKPFRQWSASGHGAIRFLRVIRPYLRIKAAQADLAFEFFEFMQRPKMERCMIVKSPSPRAPFHTHVERTPATLARELIFKDRMHALNRKGAVS